MNEAEIVNTPVEDEAFFSLDEIHAEEAKEEATETAEDTAEPSTEEVSTPAEPEVKEVDFKPLLDEVSKRVKHLDDKIDIQDLDDLITNYQKGLDYDRKTEKLNEIENSADRVYIRNKAKENGMTPEDYVKALKDYELQQEKQQEEYKLQEMIDNGVSETIAREVIETGKVRKELQQEKLRLAEQEKLIKDKQSKDAENNLFLETYPDVDVKSIPKEVFKEAETKGLLTAYTQYQNEQLKKELELLKQNKQNKETSPIKGTTEHGGVVIETKDDFLTGLGIE